MRELGIYSSDGKAYARLRNQMERLFNASVRLIYEDKHGKQFVSSAIADRGEFWWDPKRPNERVLWDSKIRLGEDFFNEIISHPVPIEMNTLTALKRSPLGLDLYLWLTYRTFALRAPATALLAAGVPSVRSGTGSGQRQSYRPSLPPESPARAKEDQDGLAGPELHNGQGRLDPLALEARDCTHDRPTASRGVAPGIAQERPDASRGASDGGETTFHGKAENPHPKGRLKTGKFRRWPPADAVRALHPARATGQRQSVVPEMPPVPQEGPLTRVQERRTRAVAPFPTSQTAERLRALLRAVFGVIHRSL